MDRIDALLGTVSDPQFTAVLRGEPLSVPGTPLVAYWLSGRSVMELTLADSSSTTDFTIRAYFRMQASADVRESVELNIWDAAVNIATALRSDTNLAGNVSDATIGDMTTGYTDIGGVAYRTLEVPYSVLILGEVTITP
tara:strand:- start:6281 stop:6697 length:417 start_codon:yes stop_codon:yes gene_type:complete